MVKILDTVAEARIKAQIALDKKLATFNFGTNTGGLRQRGGREIKIPITRGRFGFRITRGQRRFKALGN